eukprot:3549265-Rhodomonas_salina.1
MSVGVAFRVELRENDGDEAIKNTRGGVLTGNTHPHHLLCTDLGSSCLQRCSVRFDLLLQTMRVLDDASADVVHQTLARCRRQPHNQTLVSIPK